eukprot:CAMPEP_0198218188 /NCGR_PEP_ID=MMETSP1445-20131203/67846_1 /TAXON_ID=36898 /ORGANISM="Pyramimonas sp., Strain CCMP2087" /LENGTH=102 /DNA_ID=CAMNT_0043895107 /DNA_START=191 /DNA_END=499 /DNA_ORIENTATION=-
MVASALHLARLAGLEVRLVVGLHRVVMVAVENITIVGQADLRPLRNGVEMPVGQVVVNEVLTPEGLVALLALPLMPSDFFFGCLLSPVHVFVLVQHACVRHI